MAGFWQKWREWERQFARKYEFDNRYVRICLVPLVLALSVVPQPLSIRTLYKLQHEGVVADAYLANDYVMRYTDKKWKDTGVYSGAFVEIEVPTAGPVVLKGVRGPPPHRDTSGACRETRICFKAYFPDGDKITTKLVQVTPLRAMRIEAGEGAGQQVPVLYLSGGARESAIIADELVAHWLVTIASVILPLFIIYAACWLARWDWQRRQRKKAGASA